MTRRAIIQGGSTAALLAAMLFARPVAAQDARERAMAESLFQDAIKLFDDGKTAEACPLFEQSFKLDPKLGTKMNVALCNEKLGRTASAWADYTEAASMAAKAKDKREAVAREHEKALSAKLSKITVLSPPAPAGVRVTLDQRPLDAGLLGVPFPVDPGKHQLQASASGYRAWSLELDVAVGPVEQPIQIPALERDEPKLRLSIDDDPKPPPPPVPKPPAERPAANTGGVHPVAIAGFSVAGASLLTGIITGGVSVSMASTLKESCTGGVCRGDDADDLSQANALANASNAMFGVTGVAALVGVVFLFVDTGDAPPPKSAVRWVGVGDAGLGVALPF